MFTLQPDPTNKIIKKHDFVINTTVHVFYLRFIQQKIISQIGHISKISVRSYHKQIGSNA